MLLKALLMSSNPKGVIRVARKKNLGVRTLTGTLAIRETRLACAQAVQTAENSPQLNVVLEVAASLNMTFANTSRTGREAIWLLSMAFVQFGR